MANRVTDKQKSAIDFCETCLNITFTGNLNDVEQVSEFLNEYLEEAELVYNDLKCEYEAYLWELN